MKTTPRQVVAWIATALLAVGFIATATAATGSAKTRILLVTGGHDFEREPFFKLFQDNADLTVTAVEHPKAHDFFKPEAARQYDVIVLYDMNEPISDEAKTNFVRLLQQGKGVVALHHCLGSYQKWDEYAQIVGGKYHLAPYTVNGVAKPASTYKHGVKFRVRVARHPVTRGLADFDIEDETYGLTETRPGSQVFLTTDEPSSSKSIGWAHTYGKSRVVYLALGHDHLAYENPNFRQLVAQAIAWTAGGK